MSKFKEEDPNFEYEIVTPVPPEYKVMTEFMNPLDVPKDNVIVQNLEKAYRRVSGRAPDKVGAILTQSYAGNDSCHIWEAGIPVCLMGAENGRDQKGEPDSYVIVPSMVAGAGEDVRDGGAGLVQPGEVGGEEYQSGGTVNYPVTALHERAVALLYDELTRPDVEKEEEIRARLTPGGACGQECKVPDPDWDSGRYSTRPQVTTIRQYGRY